MGRFSWLLVAVLSAAAALAGAAARVQGAPAPSTRPELQRILGSLVAGPNRIAPGATAYVSGPHGTWSGAAGRADVRTGAKMAPDARMRLESVSKLWTAVLVLQLVGEGKLGLDDPVARVLPGLLPFGGRITIRQLLNHTSGILDSNDVTAATVPTVFSHIKDPGLRAQVTAIQKKLAKDPAFEFSPFLWVKLAATQPLRFPPGTGYHYSNIGYVVLGLVAEKLDGAPLARLYEKRIIRPLGLASAAYDPHATIAGPHAHGYGVGTDGTATDTTTWTEGLGANGGIVSDARDEARFLTALMQGRLLRPAELAALKTPSLHSGSYGFGTGVDLSDCAGIAYGHNGGGAGFTTSVFVSGDGTRVAVVLANARNEPRGDLAVFGAMSALYCAA